MRATIATILVGAMLLGTPTTVLAQGTEEYQGDGTSGYDDGPVRVTMYHHVYNLLDKVPMNTQAMDDAAPDLHRGRTGPTAETPAGPAPGSNANYLFMYNSPGPVHYNTSLREPRFHPERGLAEDLHLAGEELTAYWHMSADAAELLTEVQGAQAGVIPQVNVVASLRLGDDIEADLDAGQLVAQGEVTLDIVTPPNGGPMEIEIPMGSPQISTIPADESFNLKIEWHQVDQNGVKIMDRQWNIHTGTEFPNRLEMTIENPIRLNYVHPQPIGERKIAFHTAFVTPYGNYDVDLDELSFEVRDSDGNVINPTSLQGPIVVQKSYVHNHHFEPVLATWVWNYRADDAAAGDYEITVSASNLQNSATAEKTASFTIQERGTAVGFSDAGEEVQPLSQDEEEETNESPIGLAPFIVAIVGALAMARLRRRG